MTKSMVQVVSLHSRDSSGLTSQPQGFRYDWRLRPMQIVVARSDTFGHMRRALESRQLDVRNP